MVFCTYKHHTRKMLDIKNDMKTIYRCLPTQLQRSVREIYCFNKKLMYVILGRIIFYQNLNKYYNQNPPENFKIKIKNMYPMFYDRFGNASEVDSHYFLQDIMVARQIRVRNPQIHYDIGSRVDGFISHLLCFRDDVVMIDIRPLPYEIEGLRFIRADATTLDGIEDNSLESLSSLHVIEHFGLGRYGDPVDPWACFKALRSMERVIQGGGYLYISVPVGNEEKVCFDGHRIFRPETIVGSLPLLTLEEFICIKDMRINKFVDLVECSEFDYGDYSCGIFIFRKL